MNQFMESLESVIRETKELLRGHLPFRSELEDDVAEEEMGITS